MAKSEEKVIIKVNDYSGRVMCLVNAPVSSCQTINCQLCDHMIFGRERKTSNPGEYKNTIPESAPSLDSKSEKQIIQLHSLVFVKPASLHTAFLILCCHLQKDLDLSLRGRKPTVPAANNPSSARKKSQTPLSQ